MRMPGLVLEDLPKAAGQQPAQAAEMDAQLQLDVRSERLQNNYDFLRILATLCITFAHSFLLLNKGNEELILKLTNGKLSGGLIGITIFFSVSGYLITKSVFRSPTVKNYIWKRFLRVQPLLTVVCILTVFLVGPFFTVLKPGDYFTHAGVWSYFRNIMPIFGLQFTLPGVFVHNVAEQGVNGSLWTLIVEERLYVFMCVLFLLKKNKRYFILLVMAINAAYFLDGYILHTGYIPYLEQYYLYYALVFFNSAVLYIISKNLPRSPWLLIIPGLILFFLSGDQPAHNFLTFFSIPLIVTGFAQIKCFLNYAGKWGDFTYGTYVFSFPIQQMLIARNVTTNPYMLFLLATLFAVPLAVLSWHLIEKKFLRLKGLVK